MTSLLLSPHNDDAELFACFTLLRERPHVVVVLRSANQAQFGISAETREAETAAAMEILGCSWEQWPYLDNQADWAAIRARLEALRKSGVDCVYAPAIQVGGHPAHNRIGELADEVFGDCVTHYLTYTFRGGKSMHGAEVHADAGWVLKKLQALACYRSQIETEQAGCTPHFLRDQREFYDRVLVDPSEMSAVIVTRGDVDLDPILEQLKVFDDVVVWDNSRGGGPDQFVFGRYVGAQLARNDLVYVQDDDALVPIDLLLRSYRRGERLCNMPDGFAHHPNYAHFSLIGWGAIFPRADAVEAFERYHAAGHPPDEEFMRRADVVFTTLAPFRRVDVGHEDLPWATSLNRTYRAGETDFVGSRLRVLEKAVRVRDRATQSSARR
jgi:LmbE family N-acetylglucosaminyl deacetylase